MYATPLWYPNRSTQHGSRYWRYIVEGSWGNSLSFTDSSIQKTGCKDLFQKEVMIEKSSIWNVGTDSFKLIYAALSHLVQPDMIHYDAVMEDKILMSVAAWMAELI